jgi:5'-3' exonuclease
VFDDSSNPGEGEVTFKALVNQLKISNHYNRLDSTGHSAILGSDGDLYVAGILD